MDVNKQLVIYKDASELELDTADLQAAELASQVSSKGVQVQHVFCIALLSGAAFTSGRGYDVCSTVKDQHRQAPVATAPAAYSLTTTQCVPAMRRPSPQRSGHAWHTTE